MSKSVKVSVSTTVLSGETENREGSDVSKTILKAGEVKVKKNPTGFQEIWKREGLRKLTARE